MGLDSGADLVVAPGAAPGLWLRDAGLAPQVRDWARGQDWAGPLLARDPSILPAGDTLPLATLGSAHRRSPDLVLTFAGSAEGDAWGLPGHAPFDAPDVPEGGGMHGGLHRAELATVLIAQGGPIRTGAVVIAPCDLTDIAPTILHVLGVEQHAMEGEVLHAALDGIADGAPAKDTILLPGGYALDMHRSASGRAYPIGLRLN